MIVNTEFDALSAVSMPTNSTVAVNYSIPTTSYTTNFTLNALQTITLPNVATFGRRMLVLVNPTATAKVVSSYTSLLGSASTALPANSSLTLQSDGTAWRQIGSGGATNNVLFKGNTTPLTLDSTHKNIELGSLANGLNITLPSAAGINGREYHIYYVADAAPTTAITVSSVANTIGVNGTPQTSVVLRRDNLRSVTFISDGGNWHAENLVYANDYATTGHASTPTQVGYFTPNTNGGSGTLPASATQFETFDGNYVGNLTLPSAVGRTGILSIFKNNAAGFTVTVEIANSSLVTPVVIAAPGSSIHFVASGGLWRWVDSPYGAGQSPSLAEFGEVIPAPSAQQNFTTVEADVVGAAFTLPSAGVWEVSYNVSLFSQSSSRTLVKLTNAANVEVANSRAQVNNGATLSDVWATVSQTIRITTTGSTAYKMRGLNTGGSGGILANNQNANVASNKITWKKISGFIPVTALLPEVTQFVALDTPVTIDNLRIEARLTGGQGFRLGTVAGTMLVNVSGVTSYAADAVFSSNRPGVTLTTTMTHPFIWIGQSDADGMTGQIFDRTNNRFYEFTIMTNVAPTLSYIRIKRTL